MTAVLAGSSVPGLAQEIAHKIKAEYIAVETRHFPDGELHINITQSHLPKKVIYVQTMSPSPNDKLIEALLTFDLLKDLGCREIVAVLPYLGYTRQDHRKAPGEAVNVKTVMNLLADAGVNEIVSADIHLHRLDLSELKQLADIEIKEVSAIKMLAENSTLKNPLVIAPDVEALRWAEAAAKALKTDYAAMEKKRITPSEVQISFGGLNVEGRNVILADDIVSTGGTMVEAAQILKKRGSLDIGAIFTHAVFSSTVCPGNLFNAGIKELVSTNTIRNEFARVSVAGAVANAVYKV